MSGDVEHLETQSMAPVEFIVDQARVIKAIKLELEAAGAFRGIETNGGSKIVRSSLDVSADTAARICTTYQVSSREYSAGAPRVPRTLEGFAESYLHAQGFSEVETAALLRAMPQRYTLYPPLVLFSHSGARSFEHDAWGAAFARMDKDAFFAAMLASGCFPTGYTHVAANRPIVATDAMRRPFNIAPLYGELLAQGDAAGAQLWEQPTAADFARSVWCSVVQNGIRQTWSPVFTMFSRGNIKEKKRILDTYPDVAGRDVVDLYAGIGYFTLSYLARGARSVYCFELNPWSFEGLRRGLAVNAYPGSCYAYNESNESAPARLAGRDLDVRHINLGLLPSSRPGWGIAMGLALAHGCRPITTLHIHENAAASELHALADTVADELRALAATCSPGLHVRPRHLEKIKTFAPDVWHVCLDVDVSRSAE
ncbi:ADL199Wp [Eremothecium gossypii ATCC 10895]|uniref:tRNA wybutosine-synthesizing protein 2 n=1 Tax=Eremothecium gossypii (strain ATCC 10895 / CBS 109.51 / FGSC 9923 / NRRL Y-1056) TaxID=284811 RepID=Q75AW9_EREGS|nr:ADL199Wp [Eremothecium gossypii ATCC 10895]AAS51721.2 ADL199Wp [Eremothecium gossypii ATCC 10895]AEY96018.1 FADL199Wp [Eremothecium gossypii FDAG1]